MESPGLDSECMITSDTVVLLEYQGPSQIAMVRRVKHLGLLSIGFI